MSVAPTYSPCLGRADAVRLFVSEAPLNIAMTDREGRFVAASPPFLKNVGCVAEAIAGRELWAVIGGSEAGFHAVRATLEAGAPGHTVVREVKLLDGRTQWFRSDASAWRNDAGEVAGYLFINQDITAEREAENARREMEDLLQAVVDHIPATLSVQDLDTDVFALLNARARSVLNLTHEQIKGASVSQVLTNRQVTLNDQERAKLRDGVILVNEHSIADGPAAGRTLRLKRLMFHDRLGRPRMLSIGEDVTDLRKATRALEAALKEAEDANRAKTAFLATMSHEIRTPLNGVIGMVQAMARDPLSKAQRRRLDIVHQSGEALLAIVNDALDISKIEAGKLELETVEFDLAEVVEGAAAGFSAMAGSKGLGLVVDTAEAAGAYLGDPTRLRQIVSNLISNAVKFTTAGEVRISAVREGEMLVLSVADTGPGMAPDVLARLFGKFVQADASTARRFGGTGLGLSICRDLAELMGGTIRAESTPGEGARFIVGLPLPRIGDARATARPQAEIHDVAESLRILAAEDNAVNQEVLKTIFDQVGVGLSLVADGAAALEAYRSQAWDVILMDVQMPVMDGPTAVRQIREIERREGRARTPVIALTADAMEHQRAELLACGCDRTVTKPLQIAELFAAIEALVSGEDDGRQTESAARA